MKVSKIGFLGAILTFVGLALPWWTISVSSSILQSYGQTAPSDSSAYLYQLTFQGGATIPGAEYWWGWLAFALVLAGGIIGLTGSVISGKRRVLLLAGAALVLAAVVLFPVAVQLNISGSWATTLGAPEGTGLFSSGSISHFGVAANFSTFLTFGFWIALVGTVFLLVAGARRTPTADSAQSVSTQPK